MSTGNLDDLEAGSDSGPNYRVPALEKGLDVLECLAAQGVPMTQSQLARQLERGPSEIFRTLMTLERRGYIQREVESGAYSLTLRLYEVSHTHSPYEELLRAAARPMRELVTEVRESCHMSVINNGSLLVLAQEESAALVRMSIAIGGTFPLLHTASGRLLMAHLPPDQLAETLENNSEYNKWTPAQKYALNDLLKKINKQGYEYVYDETNSGVHDLAVLIGSETSRIRAALTMTALSRNPGTFVEKGLPSLRQCAQAVGRRAGIIV
jgi:DNA-binding IclR family transcriptional regulator